MNALEKPDLSLVVNNEDQFFSLPCELRPQVPDGNYHFKLVKHYTCLMFGKRPKLVLEMTIIDSGEHHGTMLTRYYNLKELRKAGKFVPPMNGDFLREYFKLLPDRNVRRDRISLAPFYNLIIVGEVSTVDRNNQGKRLPKALQYSKVNRLIELKEDLP